MKILYSHRIQSHDGQSVHVEELIRAFRAHGHEVLVVGPSFYDQSSFGGESKAVAILRRLLPGVRTFIALPAGIARMPQLRFHIYTFIGSWPWCFALAYVGMKAGESWNDPNSKLKKVLHKADAAIVLLVLAGIVWFVWTHLKNAKQAEA
jgi:uncharacterized membrane protein YdjX (TVP38/TMEM64 family)